MKDEEDEEQDERMRQGREILFEGDFLSETDKRIITMLDRLNEQSSVKTRLAEISENADKIHHEIRKLDEIWKNEYEVKNLLESIDRRLGKFMGGTDYLGEESIYFIKIFGTLISILLIILIIVTWTTR